MLYDLILESVNPKYRAAVIWAAFGLGRSHATPMDDGGVAVGFDHSLPPDLLTIASVVDSVPRLLASRLDQETAERFRRELERGAEGPRKNPIPPEGEVACGVTIRPSDDP